MSIRDSATFSPFLTALEERVSKYSALQAQLDAAGGDKAKAVAAFMKSDDEKATKYRDQIAQLQQYFKQYAEESTQVQELPEDEKKRLESARNEARKKVRDTISSLQMLAAPDMQDCEAELNEYFAEHPDPTKQRVSTGTSLPKLSCTVVGTVSSAPDKPQQWENLSTASNFLGVKLASLQEQIAKEARLPVAELAKLDKTVQLTTQAPGSEVTWDVTVTPKERKKPGRPAKD